MNRDLNGRPQIDQSRLFELRQKLDGLTKTRDNLPLPRLPSTNGQFYEEYQRDKKYFESLNQSIDATTENLSLTLGFGKYKL